MPGNVSVKTKHHDTVSLRYVSLLNPETAPNFLHGKVSALHAHSDSHTHTRVCEPFYLDHKKYFCGNKTIDTYAISRSSGTAKKRKIKSQCVPQIKFLSLTRVSSDNLRRPAEQQPLNFNVNFVKILYIDTQSTTFTSSLLVWFDFAT